MPARKRAPPSAESHIGKKPRTSTSAATEQLLPGPLSTSEVTSPATQQLPPSPVYPGKVKTRERGALSKLPPGSDIFQAFAKVRAAKDLSDEEAFLELLAKSGSPHWTMRGSLISAPASSRETHGLFGL